MNTIPLEYFKALRGEIDKRIRIESDLSLAKYTACIALLGYLVTAQNGTRYLVLAPLLAIALDFAIHHNLAVINAIGWHLRNSLEPYLKSLQQQATSSVMPDCTWTPYEIDIAEKFKQPVFLLDRVSHIASSGIIFGVCLVISFTLSSFDLTVKEDWLFSALWVGAIALLILDFQAARAARAVGA